MLNLDLESCMRPRSTDGFCSDGHTQGYLKCPSRNGASTDISVTKDFLHSSQDITESQNDREWDFACLQVSDAGGL